MPEGLDMAYVDSGGWTRQKTLNAAASLLIQGAVIYGIVTGLSVVVLKHHEKNPQGVPVDAFTPQPEPQPSETVRAQPETRTTPTAPMPRIPLGDPAPMPTQPPPLDGPTAGPTEAPVPVPTQLATPSPAPHFTPQRARARNDPLTWASTSDYPARDLAEGNAGTVRYEVTVNAEGRANGCRVVGSSGHPGLDTTTCNLVTRRARFDPARDDTGATVAGTYSGKITWQIPQD